MTRFKRRVLFGLGLIVLVLVGLGVWFYYVYFASTGTMLYLSIKFFSGWRC